VAKRIGETARGLPASLDAAYPEVAAKIKKSAVPLSPAEKELTSRVPVNVGTLDEYFGKRGYGVGFPGLHSIMAKECYCFIDGKRTGLDIFRAVQAEALSVGSFYYGTVTPEAVLGLLDEAVKKGVLIYRGGETRRRLPPARASRQRVPTTSRQPPQ
jgi:hypothetical protein